MKKPVIKLLTILVITTLLLALVAPPCAGFKKKFMKKLLKATLIGKALGGSTTKIIIPLMMPLPIA